LLTAMPIGENPEIKAMGRIAAEGQPGLPMQTRL
jgi:hypothetical protein